MGVRWLSTLASAGLLLAACYDWHADHRELNTGALVLGPEPLLLRTDPPLRAPGPHNELCLEVASEHPLSLPLPGPDMWKVPGPDGAFITPTVVLVAPSGAREEFPLVRFSFGEGNWVCFETNPARDLDRRYDAIELRADGPLRILRARWEAGERYAWL